MGDYKISVEEAVALSNGELNKDDVYSLIQANEVPGCIYVKKNEEKERGKQRGGNGERSFHRYRDCYNSCSRQRYRYRGSHSTGEWQHGGGNHRNCRRWGNS